MRNEIFGRLLKGAISSISHYEGKTAPFIEENLGQKIGVQPASIQRYKAGHLPPEPRTIEILAEAAVKRGYLNREWLQAFLRAAHHPAPEKLLDKLCPLESARPRPERIYENLPAPTYSQFIMREQAFAEVVEGLSKRSSAVLIVGFGGNGKTSLAREIAARCLMGVDSVPQFDAAVWVSDKDRPCTTNLSIVLDEIARTLDYPGFTQFEHEEKRREVEQLLRRQHVLVVVDNFETITDGGLLSWLLNLPEPSKALITTREYRREYRRGGWPVELRGMTEAEARELVAERVRVLKIEKLVGNLTQLEPLLIATGGNPKAIEMTMGLLKYERRPLQQVVDDLYAARGELFDDLFARAWALLDEAARRVLLSTTFFPDSASGEALSATADVRGMAFDLAVERLADLALLDVQQFALNSPGRHALHPLVRAFAVARLHEMPDLEKQARIRWMRYFLEFARRSIVQGFPSERYWDSVINRRALQSIDPEWINLHSVIVWADESRQDEILVELMMVLIHYMDRRVLYEERIDYAQKAAEAARRLDQKGDEAWFRIDGCAWALDEENRLEEALEEIRIGLDVVRDLEKNGIDVSDWIALAYAHMARMYLQQREVRRAKSLIKDAEKISCGPSVRSRVLITAGELAQAEQNAPEAIRQYLDALKIIREHRDEEGHSGVRYRLGFAYLTGGDLEKAEAEFTTLSSIIQEADTIEALYGKYGLARVARAKGDIENARRLSQETIDTLSRMRTAHRLRKDIKEFLAALEAHDQPPLLG